jgi:hypothetical protein
VGNNFVSEAYKPAEKLAFNYLMLRETLNKLLREQKFPKEIESMLLKIYQNFQANANKLVALYRKESNVLSLDKLLTDVLDEVEAIFIDADLDEPLIDEVEATKSLTRFIADLKTSFLDSSEEYKNAIPKFTWDIESFKKAFKTVERKAIDYVYHE